MARKRSWLIFLPFHRMGLHELARRIDDIFADHGVWRSGTGMRDDDSDDFEPYVRDWYVFKKPGDPPKLAIPLSEIPGHDYPPYIDELYDLCLMYYDDFTHRQESEWFKPFVLYGRVIV